MTKATGFDLIVKGLAVIVLSLSLAACSGKEDLPAAGLPSDEEPPHYLVGAGDSLSIFVWRQCRAVDRRHGASRWPHLGAAHRRPLRRRQDLLGGCAGDRAGVGQVHSGPLRHRHRRRIRWAIHPAGTRRGRSHPAPVPSLSGQYDDARCHDRRGRHHRVRRRQRHDDRPGRRRSAKGIQGESRRLDQRRRYFS